MALLLAVLASGCSSEPKSAAPSSTPVPPTVTSVAPANATPGVAINRKVTATFSEPMSSATVTAPGTFTVTGPFITPVSGTVTYDGPSRTATFTPSGNLLNNTTYNATISTGAGNLAGTALANPFVWSFSTAVTPDSTAPLVSFTAPAQGDASVAVNRKIVATFNEAMDPATITAANISVIGPGGSVPGTVTYAAGSFAAIFTPEENLATGATYTKTITTGVRDLAGNPMAANKVWSFTTAAAPDTTAPRVSSTSPAHLAATVPVNKKINATFNEAMDPLTIITANFMLMNGSSPVTGTISYDVPNNIATFTPLKFLAFNTTYTALITAGPTDLAGNAMGGGVVPNPWSFTTAEALLVPPTVTAVAPANATTGVAINRKVTATFSEPMSSATVTALGAFTVTGPFVSPVTGTVTYDGPSRTATFTPSGNLLNSTTYNATISTGAENLAGTALANPFVWSFSTALTPDTTAPLVSFTAPAHGDASVAINRKIIATFNEAMDPATIISANITVAGPGGIIAGALTYGAGSFAAIFTPAGNLATGATYTTTITTGVRDLAGNPMAAGKIWSFTTADTPDTTAPRVSSTNPADLAAAVPVDKKINATFSEAMDPLTIITTHFVLMDGATPITGTVAYDAVNNIATFTPLSYLTFNTTYTALITAGPADLAGNALGGGVVPNPWSFTTEAVHGPALLIDLGLATPFAVSAAAGMTNVGSTTVNGDVLLTPTATCNSVAWPGCGGTAPGLNGTVLFGADPDATAVRADLLAAYNSISPANLPGAIVLGCGTIGSGGDMGTGAGCAGNSTLPPGVYLSATDSSIGVTGILTLDGLGDPHSQFVFQAPSALTTASGSEIRLINGASASNVWWWVGSSATLGTYTLFQGNVLANTTITMGTSSSVCGRMLAGAVTDSGQIVFDASYVSVPVSFPGSGCPL